MWLEGLGDGSVDGTPGRKTNGELPQIATVLTWTTKGSLAVLDEGVYATSNFLVSILAARWLEAKQYGVFTTTYSVFLLLAALHVAILSEPLTILGPGPYATSFRRYFAIVVRLHWSLMVPLSMALVAVALGLQDAMPADSQQALISLAAAAPFILLLWLARRAFYARLEPGWPAAAGIVYSAAALGLLWGLHRAGKLSPGAALLAMGGAGFVAGALLLGRLAWGTPRPRTAGTPTFPAVAVEHWKYGRWFCAVAIAGWFPSNIYYTLLPAQTGFEGSGVLRAQINLAMPPLHCIAALSALVVTVLVQDLSRGGEEALDRRVRSVLAGFFALSIASLVTVVSLGPAMLQFAYGGGRYRTHLAALILVGLLPIGQSCTSAFGCALRALRRPDLILWSHVGACGVSAAVGVPLSAVFGVEGALVGILLSYLTSGALMARYYRATLNERVGRTSVPDGSADLLERSEDGRRVGMMEDKRPEF